MDTARNVNIIQIYKKKSTAINQNFKQMPSALNSEMKSCHERGQLTQSLRCLLGCLHPKAEYKNIRRIYKTKFKNLNKSENVSIGKNIQI